MASMHVVEGHSVVVPLRIEGLPEEIEALGERWLRKSEFHMTVISARIVEQAGSGRADTWELVTRALSGREIGVIEAGREVRRVAGHPQKPGLRTLVVMVRAPGLEPAYRDLAAAFGVPLSPPPAHVTLYSSDPAQGIGLDDVLELGERAPALAAREQHEVRRAMSFDAVFGGG